MKNALMLACAWLAATGIGLAQSTEESAGQAAAQAHRYREALAQYTAALQKTAEGSADEQRIAEAAIGAARNVTPAPPVPEDARRFFVRGTIAVKEARTAADFDAGAKEFGMAVRAAPWWPEAYFNHGIALEAAGRYDEAIRALKLYVLAAPGAADAGAVKDRIYGLEYRQEKARNEASAAQQDQQRRIREAQAKYGRWLGEWSYEASAQWPGMSVQHVGIVTFSVQDHGLEGRLRYTGHYRNGEYSSPDDKPAAPVLRGADPRGTGAIEWVHVYAYPAGNCYRPDEWRPAKLVLSADANTATYTYALASLHHQTCTPTGYATMSVKLTRRR